MSPRAPHPLAFSALVRATVPIFAFVLLGVGPVELDSQYVLQRYVLAIGKVAAPKVVVYSYTVSQVGPSNIEQYHRIYRSGLDVRDETLSIDGIPLRRKIVHFSRREDRYSVRRFAPLTDAYQMLFLGTTRDGRHFDYVYEATPLSRASGTWIDQVTIDGANFLPRSVHFHSSGLEAYGRGSIEFGSFGRYWMPIAAAAQAEVKGKPARELITWSDYRFPTNLPPSTFQPPEPLPRATISPV